MRAARVTLGIIWLYLIALLFAGQSIATGSMLEQYTRVQSIFVFLGMGLGNLIILLIAHAVLLLVLPPKKIAGDKTKGQVTREQGGHDLTNHPAPKSEKRFEPHNQVAEWQYKPKPSLGDIASGNDIIELIRPYSYEAVREIKSIVDSGYNFPDIVTKAAEVCGRISSSQMIKELSYVETREDGSLKNFTDYEAEHLYDEYIIASKYDPANKCHIYTIVDESRMPKVPALYRTREAACISLVGNILKRE